MGISIDEIINKTRAKFNDNSIVMKLTEKNIKTMPAWKTGIPQLDIIVGVGGFPKGRIIEIYGPESSGKTTAALTVIAQAQKDGAWAWYGDMEHSLDPKWAEKLGVNLDKLLLSQPSNAEECLSLTEHFIETGVIDIVIVDSVSSLVPRAELEGEFGESHMGLQARLMSQAMRKLTAKISKTESTAIFINQIRDKIGVRWGSPETTSGGRALKFYATVRIDVRRTGEIGKKGESIGCETKFTAKKNKVAPPFRICQAELIYKKGFDLGRNLLETGLLMDIINKDGRTYSITLGEEKLELGVGRNAAAEFINNYEKEVLEFNKKEENKDKKKQSLYDFIVNQSLKRQDDIIASDEEQPRNNTEEIGGDISEAN